MQHDPDDHERRTPHLAFGVVAVLATIVQRLRRFCDRSARCPRRRPLRILALALLVPCVVACAGAPEALVSALEDALRSGDRAQIAALLTEESRSLLETMIDTPHPEGRWPLGLHAPSAASHVVSVTPSGAGVVVLEVEDEGGKSDWVLRQEGGRWRLDLIASATRRPLFGY